MKNGNELIQMLREKKVYLDNLAKNTPSNHEHVNIINGVRIANDTALGIMEKATDENGCYDFNKVQHAFNLHMIRCGVKLHQNPEFYNAKHTVLRGIFDTEICIIE